MQLRGQGPSLVIPAETIGSASGTYGQTATHVTLMRRVFFAQGLWWAVYFDGTDFVYVTSSDALNWSAPTILFLNPGIIMVGGELDVVYDQGSNTFIWVQANPSSGNRVFYYRFGNLRSDGTIAWVIPQTGHQNTGAVDSPSLAFDSSGNLFAAFKSVQLMASVEVWKLAKPFTGVWSFSANINSGHATDSLHDFNPLIRAFTGGKMVLIANWGRTSGPLFVYSFSGSSWTGPSFTQNSYFLFAGTAVTVGDVVYFVCPSVPPSTTFVPPGPSGDLVMVVSQYPCASFLETVILGDGSAVGGSISWDGGMNFALAIAHQNGDISLALSSDLGSSWSPFFTVTSGEAYTSWSLITRPEIVGGLVPVLWTAGAGPYSVRFAVVSMSAVPPPQPSFLTGPLVAIALVAGGTAAFVLWRRHRS